MQQQLCQPDQLGNQQAMSQQMVLCPVRLVYETQIFMQPGDQIQPNQTFFINPHNPPPWAQNRQQNQVLYVHQFPNNIVPNIQQHMDQNQFYVQQNYANYQISHPMLAPSQEQIRPMQITNMIPSNMVQNCPSVQNERNVGQTFTTYGHMANTGQNTIANQANGVLNKRQMITNVGTATQTNQSIMNTQPIAELQRQGVYTNVKPQMLQQHTITRPQVTMNSVQNIQNVQQQQTIGQTYVQNIGQAPVQVQNQMSNVHRTVQTANNMTNVTKMREPPISNINTNTFNASVSNTRSVQTYAYRPIQPRPQFRQIVPNIPNPHIQVQPTSQVQHIPTTVQTPNKDNRFHNVPNVHNVPNASYTTIDSKHFNRKRKSESPDELHAKMSAFSSMRAIDNVNLKQGNVTVKKPPTLMDIGVNTNPINKIEYNVSSQNSNAPQTVRFVDSGQQTMQIEKAFVKPFNDTVAVNKTQTDKEKLIRNTVYTQARGRLLSDKQSTLNNDSINAQDVNTQDNHTKEIRTEKSETQLTNLKSVETEHAKETPSQIIITPIVECVNKDDDMKIEKNTENINSEASKEDVLQPADKVKFKQENDYILTHVLDGYVIQESNIAFPIRKPLKEKTPNMDKSDEKYDKDENINDKVKEEAPRDNSKIIDLPLLPLYYLHLNNENKEDGVKTESKEDVKKERPFASIPQATVKCWTTDQLAAHLTQYSWTETVSVLQEHEIDGESLFLVSKAQLVRIGVSEDHAEVICEFVKKH